MKEASRAPESNVWAVLVAGEHHTVSKTLGGHSSITSIGDAYNILRQHLPRERIIVIAQVDECRIWHDQPFEEKVKDVKDSGSAERQRPMWAEKKISFWKHLGQMIDEGGADYDGSDVNPDTVLRVILGDHSEKYPRVVNYEDGKTKLFFSLFGHGSWSGKNNNHYFYMPYPSEPVLDSLSQTMRPVEDKIPSILESASNIGIVSGNDFSEIQNNINNCNINTNDSNPNDANVSINQISQSLEIMDVITANAVSHVEGRGRPEGESTSRIEVVSDLDGLEVRAVTNVKSSMEPIDTVTLNGDEMLFPSTAMTPTAIVTTGSMTTLVPPISERTIISTTCVDPLCYLPVNEELSIHPSIDVDTNIQNEISRISVTTDHQVDSMIDISPVESEVPSTPIICEGVVDPIYQCINSHLPLSGGVWKPFRVHISRYPLPGKPPKSKSELDTQDASILHWQFLFHAFQQICDKKNKKNPKRIFIFQQSCGSGGMWLWLKENANYEKDFLCSHWPIFVGYTSEPETSAVGASWGVFFGLLAQILNTTCVTNSNDDDDDADVTSLAADSTTAVTADVTAMTDVINIATTTTATVTADDTTADTIAAAAVTIADDAAAGTAKTSSSIDILSQSLSISDFYALVTQQYYKVEPFVHHVNIQLSEEERISQSFVKFGVLGTAYGVNGCTAESSIRSFFFD